MKNGMQSSVGRDVWLELRLSPAEYTAPPPASPMPSEPSLASSGSGGAGYGLDLVVPDRFSRERILRIMRTLCERDVEHQ